MGCVFGAAVLVVAQSHVAGGGHRAIVGPGQLALQVLSAVSRKTHGAAGDFDIDLPLNPPFGIESRGPAGDHTIVVTFSNILADGVATVADGTWDRRRGKGVGKDHDHPRCRCSEWAGATLSLTKVADNFGQSLPDTTITMQALLGDTNASGAVNASDIIAAKSQIGTAVTDSNFRSDVNASGEINASDIDMIRARSGSTLQHAGAGDRMAPESRPRLAHAIFVA